MLQQDSIREQIFAEELLKLSKSLSSSEYFPQTRQWPSSDSLCLLNNG